MPEPGDQSLSDMVKRWRGDTTKGYSTRNQCADELEAALAASGQQHRRRTSYNTGRAIIDCECGAPWPCAASGTCEHGSKGAHDYLVRPGDGIRQALWDRCLGPTSGDEHRLNYDGTWTGNSTAGPASGTEPKREQIARALCATFEHPGKCTGCDPDQGCLSWDQWLPQADAVIALRAEVEPAWPTFMEWYQGERGDAAMGAIKFGEHPKDSRAALECAWHDAREVQTTMRTEPGEESEREKNIRNAAFKRGLRTAKLDHARRFFESFEHVREAFDVWRNRARSAEGKLKAALRMLGMTEHELDQALERVTAPDGPG